MSFMTQPRELKSLIEAGHYSPEPERVAVAMLRRRGVRELLRAGVALNQADRNQSPPAAGRQAA